MSGNYRNTHYTGPAGDYPVYTCRADRVQEGGPLCQEVRALPVDAHVESILLEALKPDQIAIAIAALGQIEEETRQLERQWALRRERARYEAERARRQYDAVEPENRLVARSLERAWEEELRAAEAIEQDYERWRSDEPLVLSESDRQGLQKLGEDLAWHLARTFHNIGRAKRHPASHHWRGRPRPEALPGPGLVQEPVADRSNKRALSPEAGPHL